MDTIFALATAQGKAGIAVVRVSGPAAFTAAQSLAGSLPPPRMSGLRRLTRADGGFLDEALLLCFREGESFTGEDVVELHLHGSIAVIGAVLSALGDQPGLRLAEAGEFTRRALENGRLDLAQVEALSDLIEAETEAQRLMALRTFSGALSRRVEEWRSNLIRAASLLEAVIDFADEEVPEDVSDEVIALVQKVDGEISREISGIGAAERIRLGFEVAIVGAPNVGKSTLLNALAGRDAAITSEIAGTTRDVIEVRMDLSGLPVVLIDTAGIREAEDAIEAMGVRRALDRAEQADLRVFLRFGADQLPFEPRPDDLVFWTKGDLGGPEGAISVLEGHGVERVIAGITDVLTKRSSVAGLATRERHRVAMSRAVESLGSVERITVQGPAFYDIAAEELRASIRRLEALIGRVDVESVLDEIFANFCLGK